MKKTCLIVFTVFIGFQLFAQVLAPVKLALISETDGALPAADLLTAKFSGNGQIQLLERDQIEKVYLEQGLSAANTDYLKLGHILGADGLLLLNVVRTPQTTNLVARLIAVKPGVVLSDASFGWPLNDTAQWSDSVATYLNSFLPKLTVLLKDAIPISIVNLRSAINSTDAAETERQLKLLVIQRLSQERQLFVLERQKMQLLGDEKELKADDSAFWDGSYLLEGVVDQNGYSPDTITINARLTPPRGGAPVLFVVSGSRTNLTEVINQLAVKVNDALKIQSTAPAWNGVDEAAQFFKEAQWALRWGLYSEAQSAADSAWALGKQGMYCVQLRIRAYMVSPDTGQSVVFYPARIGPDPQIIKSATHALEIYNKASLNMSPDEPKVDSDWYQFGLENLTVASRVLQAFHESPDYYQPVADELAKLRAAVRSTADWISKSPSVQESYYAGDRVVISDDLEHFEEKPSIFSVQLECGCLWQDKPEATLELYRQLMSSPVFCYLHDKFWFRDMYHRSALFQLPPRLVAWNEADQKCMSILWNGFRQELNDSTNLLLQLEAKAICLADATNETELAEAYTNFFSAVFDHADELVSNPVEILYLEWRIDDLMERMGGNTYLKNKDSLRQFYFSQYRQKLDDMDRQYKKWAVVAIKAEQFLPVFKKQKAYLQANTPYDFLKFTALFNARDYSQGQALEIRPLVTAYQSNLTVEAASADNRHKGELQSGIWFVGLLGNDLDHIIQPSDFERQKQYLQASRPFDYLKLVDVFGVRHYDKKQALELLPLVTTYQSNLMVAATSASADGVKQRDLQNGIKLMGLVVKNIDRVISLTASTLAKSQPATVSTPKPIGPTAPLQPLAVVTNTVEPVADRITVGRFFEIPSLQPSSDTTNISTGGIITAHHWFADKLVLDLEYGAAINSFDEKGNWKGGRTTTLPAIAILDLTNSQWKVVACAEVDFASQNNSYHRSVLWRGELFNSDGQLIRKYDFQKQQWLTLPVSDGNNYELFVVNDRIYAASGNIIFEIIDDGKGSRILASTRRQPPVSVLDTLDFGTPVLFEGPDHSLRIYAAGKIFTWTGSDWHEDPAAPPTSFPPEIFPDGILSRQSDGLGNPTSLSGLATGATTSELYLWQKLRRSFRISDKSARPPVPPLWQMPRKWQFAGLAAALGPTNLYLLAGGTNVAENNTDQPANMATLLYFSRGLSQPQRLLLRFENTAVVPPVEGINPFSSLDFPHLPPVWLFPVTDALIFGHERPRNYVLMGSDNSYPSGQSGVWLLPLSKIEPVIDAQKQTQFAQQARIIATAEQAQKNLLAKYDLNHNGVIDSDEKEATLDDPAFIAWQLDEIDTNHNGQLDLGELTYFDSNTNKFLEPKELAGIEIVQHLLMERDLENFDADENGFLDQNEFRNLYWSGFQNGIDQNLVFINADKNHNGEIDPAELEDYLNGLLYQKLHPHQRFFGGPTWDQIPKPREAGRGQDADQLFKRELEAYWQNPGSLTNLPTFHHRPPVLAMPVPRPSSNAVSQ